MARTDAPKAGRYEQLVDRYDEYDKDEKGRDRDIIATYTKGDIVTLTADQAERLTTGDRPSFAAPGSLAQAEADRLQAAADALKAQADDAKTRAADASKDADAAAKSSPVKAQADDAKTPS
jgi:hypothetical protein